jgi:hypothetical protein
MFDSCWEVTSSMKELRRAILTGAESCQPSLQCKNEAHSKALFLCAVKSTRDKEEWSRTHRLVVLWIALDAVASIDLLMFVIVLRSGAREIQPWQCSSRFWYHRLFIGDEMCLYEEIQKARGYLKRADMARSDLAPFFDTIHSSYLLLWESEWESYGHRLGVWKKHSSFTLASKVAGVLLFNER